MGYITPKNLSLLLLSLLNVPWLLSCLSVTPYNVDSPRLPESFNGFKIAVIADLHSHSFGKNESKLIESVMEQNPDMVVLAGDIINKRDRNTANVRSLLAGICGTFPVYAVAGNHEFENPSRFAELLNVYREYGVIFLDGQTVLFKRGEHLIAISSQKLVPRYGRNNYWINNNTAPLYKDEFNIFLHHFGNEFDAISDEYDLVISGHVHGGVIRIFKTGLFGHGKKRIFPKYSKGVYRKESGSVMVLSAGLGNTIIPRINNPRELVIITLFGE